MGIFDRYYSFFGYQIHVRAVPYEYNMAVRDLTNLFDNQNYAAAERDLLSALNKWGDTPELVRLEEMLDMELTLR